MTDINIQLSFGDNVAQLASLNLYHDSRLYTIAHTTLAYMYDKLCNGISLPYVVFEENFNSQDWITLPKSLEIYICDINEGRTLNYDARGKDYATNILSYSSDVPNTICQMMNNIPLGELVICHDVLVREASEQHKSLDDHFAHLMVHGMLHLLGFDHELGQAEQDEMEGFEIHILKKLGIANPYD